MKKILKKLKSKSGESIAEVLVATLISALALMMLANIINVSISLIGKSKDSIKRYNDAENVLVEQSGDGINGSVKITDENGYTITLTDDSEDEIDVHYYINKVLSNKPVISYKND